MPTLPSSTPEAVFGDDAIAGASRAGIGGYAEMPLRGLLKAFGSHAFRAVHGKPREGPSPQSAHLDRIVDSFQIGYRAARDTLSTVTLAADFSRIDEEHRGFVFEGAAMALLELCTPLRPRRFRRLLAAAPLHVYLLHVGAGWAGSIPKCRRARVPGARSGAAMAGARRRRFSRRLFRQRERSQARRSSPSPVALRRTHVRPGLGRSLRFTADEAQFESLKRLPTSSTIGTPTCGRMWD